MSREIDFYLDHLAELRQAVRDLLLGLAEEGLNWQPLPAATNSIYQLAQHVAWVEQWLIGHELGGQPFPYDWSAGQDLSGSGEDAADLLFWLDQAATATRQVLQGLTDSDLAASRAVQEADGGRREVVARWYVLHAVEHYAEHLGQMRLTRQLYEAGAA